MPSTTVWTSGIVKVEHSCNNYFNIKILNHCVPILALLKLYTRYNRLTIRPFLHEVQMDALQLWLLILVLRDL